MTAGLIVDGVVVIAALAAFITGWRQGATTSVLSTLGVVSGLVVSAGLIPVALRLTDSVGLRLLLAAAILILLVAVGNVAGAVVGGQLRRSFKMRSSLRIDSCIGAFFQAVTLLIVAWLVSLPLAAGLG